MLQIFYLISSARISVTCDGARLPLDFPPPALCSSTQKREPGNLSSHISQIKLPFKVLPFMLLLTCLSLAIQLGFPALGAEEGLLLQPNLSSPALLDSQQSVGL